MIWRLEVQLLLRENGKSVPFDHAQVKLISRADQSEIVAIPAGGGVFELGELMYPKTGEIAIAVMPDDAHKYSDVYQAFTADEELVAGWGVKGEGGLDGSKLAASITVSNTAAAAPAKASEPTWTTHVVVTLRPRKDALFLLGGDYHAARKGDKLTQFSSFMHGHLRSCIAEGTLDDASCITVLDAAARRKHELVRSRAGSWLARRSFVPVGNETRSWVAADEYLKSGDEVRAQRLRQWLDAAQAESATWTQQVMKDRALSRVDALRESARSATSAATMNYEAEIAIDMLRETLSQAGSALARGPQDWNQARIGIADFYQAIDAHRTAHGATIAHAGIFSHGEGVPVLWDTAPSTVANATSLDPSTNDFAAPHGMISERRWRLREAFAPNATFATYGCWNDPNARALMAARARNENTPALFEIVKDAFSQGYAPAAARYFGEQVTVYGAPFGLGTEFMKSGADAKLVVYLGRKHPRVEGTNGDGSGETVRAFYDRYVRMNGDKPLWDAEGYMRYVHPISVYEA